MTGPMMLFFILFCIAFGFFHTVPVKDFKLSDFILHQILVLCIAVVFAVVGSGIKDDRIKTMIKDGSIEEYIIKVRDYQDKKELFEAARDEL